MSKLILVVLLLSGMIADVGVAKGHQQTKQACQTKPDHRSHSAWRTINGKQCWYQGRRGMAREKLYWETVDPKKRHKEIVPLPPTPPTIANLPETLTQRLNYYFAVLSSQTYLTTPSGSLPLAMAGPWLGTPIPPGLNPVPPPPDDWTPPPPKEEPASWWKRLWEKWPWWWRD
jgi:hypothetical protein